MTNFALEKNSNNSTTHTQPEKTPSDFWLTARTNVRLQNQAPPIKPVLRNQNLLLSFNQERLWFLEQLHSNTSVHNILHCFRLKGLLDIAALKQSLGEIARRHEILRTTFSTVDEQPVQIVSSAINLKLPVIDLQELPLEQRELQAQKLAVEDAEQPFDLAKAPLWRVKLLRLDPEEHILIRTIHHLIFDGVSHSVYLRELGMLYGAFSSGQPSPLPELSVQYADFAHTQRQWLQGEVLTSQLDYWKQQLSGNVPTLELPTDYPRPAFPTYQGGCQSLELSENLTESLKKLSFQEGVSLFATLLAAFKTLLYQYTEQEDMLVCSPVAGRHGIETKKLIGFFNNIVVLRTDLSGNPSFRELLSRVSRVSSEAFARQEIPLQTVAELPNLVRTPLTRAMFVLQNAPNQLLELDGLTVSSQYVERAIANFELSLSVQEKARKLTAALQYKTDLFDDTTITQMLEHFQALLENLVADRDRPLHDFPRLAPASHKPDNKDDSASVTPKPKEQFVAPRNELELQLVNIWEKVLDTQPIGIKDNFFELGGHSLLSLSLFAQIEQVLGKKLPLSTLLEAPTIEKLAALLNSSERSQSQNSLVLLKDGKAQPPLFLIHDGEGEILLYRNLAYRLNPERPVYGIQPYRKQGYPILHTRIEDMVAYYIAQIRTVQPEGPYLLGGMCAGGVLAFEVARQLQIQGEKVALVALIDAADAQAEKRSGRIANQRLSRFSETLGQGQQLKRHERVFFILNKVRQKVFNLIVYEIQKKFKDIQSKAKMRLFRYCLDKKLPLPQFLENISVSTTFLFAEKEYDPDTLYQGEVVLFRATEGNNDVVDTIIFRAATIDDEPYVNIYSDPLLGWGKRVTKGVKVYDIPGGHSSMLQEPNVQVMAQDMQAYINAALVEESDFSRHVEKCTKNLTP